MPTRYAVIERISRAVYGEQPNEDANITFNLINQWLQEATGVAVAADWKGSLQLDGMAYINSSFYSTFSNLPIVSRGTTFYQITLPQIPMGLGRNEGISSLKLVDSAGNETDDLIPISANQWAYYKQLRRMPNKTVYKPNGIFIDLISSLPLNNYTGKALMVSGGDSTDLNSILNVPDDYLPMVTDYCINKLRIERAQPKDAVADGEDRA